MWAANGRFHRIDEPCRFRTLSSARCPTYGNCNSCYRLGPLNMRCHHCNDAKKGSALMFMIHPYNRAEERILDVEYFANLVGVANNHKVALADR